MKKTHNNDTKKKTRDLVCGYLEEGMYKKDAAELAGIDESTLYRWINSDTSFASRVQISVLKYKRSLVQVVNKSALKDGRLALEILRTRWSNDLIEEQNSQDKKSNREIADALEKILFSTTESNG